MQVVVVLLIVTSIAVQESALPKTAEAVDKEEAGRGAGVSELEVQFSILS